MTHRYPPGPLVALLASIEDLHDETLSHLSGVDDDAVLALREGMVGLLQRVATHTADTRAAASAPTITLTDDGVAEAPEGWAQLVCGEDETGTVVALAGWDTEHQNFYCWTDVETVVGTCVEAMRSVSHPALEEDPHA